MGKIEFRILKEVRCVHFKGNGDISFTYLIDQIKALQNEPGFDFSFDTFVDFENALVSYTENGIDTYQAFFSELQKAGIHRKWAIYTKDDTTFQSANMSHLLMSNDIEVDVFQNKTMALSFLGISEADLRADAVNP
jgi:hypothetical protein